MKNIHADPTRLRLRFIQHVPLHRKDERTVHAYGFSIYNLARFHQRPSPDQLKAAHIEIWLYHLIAERRLAPSSVNACPHRLACLPDGRNSSFDVARAYSPASSRGVSPRGASNGETPLELAAETAALRPQNENCWPDGRSLSMPGAPFFGGLLQRDIESFLRQVQRPKCPTRLPRPYSMGEIERLRTADTAGNLRAQAFLMTACLPGFALPALSAVELLF